MVGLVQASLVVVATSLGLSSATPISRWSAIERIAAPAVAASNPALCEHPSPGGAAWLAPEFEFEGRLGSVALRSNACALRSALLAERFHFRAAGPPRVELAAGECSRE